MDAATVFVVVITAGAIGMLAYLELKSRRQKRSASPPSERTGKPERDGRQSR